MADRDPLNRPVAAAETGEAMLDVLIVGAGISGIGMAVHLGEALPDHRYAILERRPDLGGTWDLFRYPGIRSDSDMHTLGFSFEPWREQKAIADGPSILAYLNRIADERGVRRHIRFSHHVQSADWDSEAACWRVRVMTGDGNESAIAARFLYLGAGYYDYDEPHDPAFAGTEDFTGQVIHPQFWPNDLDYLGKRIVVIGSGATAVTLVPAMADTGAGHVTMLQRTPTWYFIRPAEDVWANRLRKVMPDRWAYALTRFKNVRLQNFAFKLARRNPDKVKTALMDKIDDAMGGAPFDRAAFTPPYNPWEQRLCLVPDGDFFNALKDGRASIVTAAIDRFVAEGVKLTDGTVIPADIIVTATGLKLAVGGKVAVSVDGRPVRWNDHYYYKGCMFSNIPNLVTVFGYLNASWTLKADIVATWTCRVLRHMAATGAQAATPTLRPEDAADAEAVFDFSSGYIQRALDYLPRNGAQAPWKLNQDYLHDRGIMLNDPVEDGVLVFERARVAANA
jgi:cation diffusion facilitator CzcD-associated flavoprotein CzcO